LADIRGRMAESMKESEHKMLFRREEIAARVAEIGAQISHDFAGESVLLVGVLKGAAVFLADLARSISVETTFDFVAISSYKGVKTTGAVRLIKDLDTPIGGRNVNPGRRHPGYRPDPGFSAQTAAPAQTQEPEDRDLAWISQRGGWRRSTPTMWRSASPIILSSVTEWITRNASVTSRIFAS